MPKSLYTLKKLAGVAHIKSHPKAFNMSDSYLIIFSFENAPLLHRYMSAAVGPFESFSTNLALIKIAV